MKTKQDKIFRLWVAAGTVAFVVVSLLGYLQLKRLSERARRNAQGGDSGMRMLRLSGEEAEKRYRTGWGTIRFGVDYIPLAGKPSKTVFGIDKAWENVLNKYQVCVTNFSRPWKLKTTQERDALQASHELLTSHFLRAELLPQHQWPTQFWVAPNGDKTVVSSWKSNGFSICVAQGRSLCVAIKPHNLREIFGRTLAEITAVRATGKNPEAWITTIYLPLPDTRDEYARQIYALTTEDSAINGSIRGVQTETERSPLARLNQGRVFMYKGDKASGITGFPRNFAHDVRFWTDGITVVYVVNKQLQTSPSQVQ